LERYLEPFYNHILTVSNEVPNLVEYIGILWGLQDLFTGIEESEGLYSGISVDIKNAFLMAKEALNKWTEKIIENDLIFAVYVLNPQFKFTLIKQ
jgi:hypothetical protein